MFNCLWNIKQIGDETQPLVVFRLTQTEVFSVLNRILFPLEFVDSTLEDSVTAVSDVSVLYDAGTRKVSYLFSLWSSAVPRAIFFATPDLSRACPKLIKWYCWILGGSSGAKFVWRFALPKMSVKFFTASRLAITCYSRFSKQNNVDVCCTL